MDIIGGLILVTAVLNLFAGMIIYFYNRDHFFNKSFAFFVLNIFLWAIALYFFRISDHATAILWAKFLYIIPLMIATSLLIFAIVFPRTLGRRWWWLVVYAGVFSFAVALMISFTDTIIEGVIRNDAGENMVLFGPQYYVYMIFIFSMFVSIYGLFLYKMRHAIHHDKKIIFFITVGTGIPIIIALCTNVLLPALGYYDVTWLGQVTTIVMPLMIAFVIAKYNFLNIKMFTTQLFVFGLDLAIFLEIFSATTLRETTLRAFFFVIIAFFLQMLLHSVRREVHQKEKLAKLTEKLERANDELQRLDSAKSEFISIASHQLRTPLTAIKGYLSLIMENAYGPVPEEVSGALNKVYRSNERLIQLVEDLLNISRIESGRMEFHFGEVNISEVVQDLYDTFILRAKEKNLAFSIKTPQNAQETVVIGDQSKLREVISNLIDNALKYTKKGFVNVEVRRHKDTVQIIVEDSGIGIPKKVSSQLFKKFSRGKDPSRLHVEGTGLGLYVGKNIVEAHHGRIMVESDGVNKGARFILELPRTQ